MKKLFREHNSRETTYRYTDAELMVILKRDILENEGPLPDGTCCLEHGDGRSPSGDYTRGVSLTFNFSEHFADPPEDVT